MADWWVKVKVVAEEWVGERVGWVVVNYWWVKVDMNVRGVVGER